MPPKSGCPAGGVWPSALQMRKLRRTRDSARACREEVCHTLFHAPSCPGPGFRPGLWPGSTPDLTHSSNYPRSLASCPKGSILLGHCSATCAGRHVPFTSTGHPWGSPAPAQLCPLWDICLPVSFQGLAVAEQAQEKSRASQECGRLFPAHPEDFSGKLLCWCLLQCLHMTQNH